MVLMFVIMTVETKATCAKGTPVAPVSTLIEPGAPRIEPYKLDAWKHYNRGVELHQQGLLDAAKNDYLQAVQIDPRMEEAWCNLGIIYNVEKNYEKAEEIFKKCLTANLPPPATPGSPRYLALRYLANLYSSRGNYDKAEPLFKEALTANPAKVFGYEETQQAYIDMLNKSGRNKEADRLRKHFMP